MASRRCTGCGSSWASSLTRCAFCGGDSVPEGDPAGPMPAFFTAPAPDPEPVPAPEPEPATVAVEPAPPEDVPLPTTPVEPLVRTLPPEPLSGPEVKRLRLFSSLGVAGACFVLPALLVPGGVGAAGLLICAALVPFAPIAWHLGIGYERNCRRQELMPAAPARAAFFRAQLVTGLVAVLFALGAAIQAILRLVQ